MSTRQAFSSGDGAWPDHPRSADESEPAAHIAGGRERPPRLLTDTRELARSITSLFVGSRELSDLPRKFNIATNG